MTKLVLLLVLTLFMSAPPPGSGERLEAAEDPLQLGTVDVPGAGKGWLLFQTPADDGKGHRVDLAISKPNGSKPIDSGRIDLWLLARGGQALSIRQRPPAGPLIEVNSAGTTASAVYFFADGVPREELVAVVVSVDGKLTTWPLPPVKDAKVPSKTKRD